MKTSKFIIAILTVQWSLLLERSSFAEEQDAPADVENEKEEENTEVEEDPIAKNDPATTNISHDNSQSQLASAAENSVEQNPELVVTSENAMAENEILSNDNLALTTEEAMAEYEKAQFFLKAFGKEMPETFYDHEIQIVLDQSIAFQTTVKINPYTKGIQFYSSTLVPFLEDNLLNTPLTERLGNNLPEVVSGDFLQEQGFHIELDMERLTILVTSPVALRQTVNLFLRPQTRISVFRPDSTEPQPINGYVNMFHAMNHAGAYTAYNGQYNFNLNVQDWIVQSEMSINSARSQRTNIMGSRIVKDLRDQRIRLTFGDNRSPNTDLFLQKPPIPTGFQQALFGIDISHIAQFDQRSMRTNGFKYLLIVEEVSGVSVEVNGQIIYNKIMFPGKYEVQDFPFQTGRNDIRILCTSENGVTQDIELEYFHNPTILPQGQQEYQIISGIPYNDSSGIRNLDSNQLTNLAYWRYGLSDKVGTSAYLQTVKRNWLVGSILEYGFGSNIATVELTHSNRGGVSGNAVRLQAYSSNSNYLLESLSFLPNYYTLNIDYRSPNFDPTLNTPRDVTTNRIRSVISPAAIWQVTKFWQIQTSSVFTYNTRTSNTRSFRIQTYYRTNQWLFDASFDKSNDIEDDELVFFTTATWRPKGSRRNRLNYRYNTSSDVHRLTANIWPSTNNNSGTYRLQTDYKDIDNVSFDGTVRQQTLYNTWTTQLNRSTNDGVSSHGINVDFDGPRFLVDANHSRPAEWYPSTNLSLNTAIAFVGKHWGISRPINQSFAILYANNDGLKDSTIRFQDGSVLDKYSAAVYPFLGNYQNYEMKIHSADIPVGLDLGSQQYFLQSGLNSGQAIPIGKPGGIIMATATLLKNSGEPFDLEVGFFVNVKDPTLKSQFFTNRTGKLFVQGLQSGDYTVQFVNDKYQSLTLTIPKDAESPLDLGIITILESKQEK